MLASDDLRLIDALQVAPRAPWAAVGSVLGVSPVTAAKRWNAIAEQGAAWVTAAPGMAFNNAQCVAYVEITCRPEHRLEVATAISAHSLAVTVELTTGSADILVTVAAVDLQTLSHYLLQHLDQVEHVLSSKARIATRIYGEGSAWRLRVLDADSVAKLERVRKEQLADDDHAQLGQLSDPVKTMLTDLAVDGRASFADLAEHAGVSTSTARRHVSRLLRSGVIILRTDVNAREVNCPVQVYLWADAPADKLSETAAVLSRFPSARLTATVTAGPSLALCSWLHTVEEVHRLELAIAAKLPHMRVVDRLIVLRQVKRMGRLLDETGRAVGVVPINTWDDLLPHVPQPAGV
jgi:DNA-binding Lrp family transcriptional regulator